MNETVKETGGAGPSHRSFEIGVAVAMAILALIGGYRGLRLIEALEEHDDIPPVYANFDIYENEIQAAVAG